MFRRWRVRNASKFGRLEHRFGRLMGAFAIFTLFSHFTPYDDLELVLCFITALCWLIYLTAHTLEKKLYGHFGPRG